MFSTESIKRKIIDELISDSDYRKAFVKVIIEDVKEELK